MTRPFLRWAGSKQRLLPQLVERMPEHFADYHEPFLGAGALALHVMSLPGVRPKCYLSDSNSSLIRCWAEVFRSPGTLVACARNTDRTPYAALRSRANERLLGGALVEPHLFLALNHRGYNGLWRVNRGGGLNTPDGRRTVNWDRIWRSVQAAHEAGETTRWVTTAQRYHEALLEVRRGDFVYLDPPYDGTFGGYSSGGWSRSDTERLFSSMAALDYAGVKVMASNADTPFVRQLASRWRVDAVTVRRSIRCDGVSRTAGELIIRNY